MLQALDTKISHFIFSHSQGLKFLLPVWNWIIRVFGTIPYAVAILFAGDKMKAVVILIGAVVVGGINELGLKNFIRRPRPSYGPADEHTFGLPSTHSITTTLAFLFYSRLLELPTAVLISLATYTLLMMYSRIATGLHYVGDILGGILLGSLVYLAGVIIFFT